VLSLGSALSPFRRDTRTINACPWRIDTVASFNAMKHCYIELES
jgi:hypothetical protein